MSKNSFKSMFHRRLVSDDPHQFMTICSDHSKSLRVAQFSRRTTLQEKTSCCIVCSRQVQSSHTEITSLTDIPNVELLHPLVPHCDHNLLDGSLIHFPALETDGLGSFGGICRDCMKALKSEQIPIMSLAAGNWIGEKVAAFADLTLAEKLLIARQPCAMYIIHKVGVVLDLEHAIGMNDDSYIHAPPTVLDIMPMTMENLKSFFRVDNPGVSFAALPVSLRVHRTKVEGALRWLKNYNSHYKDISISDSLLAALPDGGVPKDLAAHFRVGDGSSSPMEYRSDFHVTTHDITNVLNEAGSREQAFSWMFPWLFSRAAGSLALASANVRDTAKWFLWNGDTAFRTDEVFVSKMFKMVMAAKIQRVVLLRRDLLTEFFNEYLIGSSRPETLSALVKCSYAGMRHIAGSVISRDIINNKYWSIIVMKGPPSFHFFLESLDVLPAHHLSSGESPGSPRDPYPTVRRLHNTVVALLEDLFGISTTGSISGVDHRTGTIGKVSAYLTSVVTNERGTLGIHIIIWITNSPTFPEMQGRLWSAEFRNRLGAYCDEAFKNLDPSADSSNTPFDFSQFIPFQSRTMPYPAYPWNRALLSDNNIQVDARFLIKPAQVAQLAAEMSSSTTSSLTVADHARSALQCVKPPSRPIYNIEFAATIVESTMCSSLATSEISYAMQMNYLMGWGDSRSSNTMVEINLNAIRAKLCHAYPDLVSHQEAEVNENQNFAVQKFKNVDVLADYAARALTMEEHNLMEFILTSMETKPNHMGFMKRWPYLEGTAHDGRSRVNRIADALPLFIGDWIPRSDQAISDDIYYALMLVLLKPWRQLEYIRPQGATWEAAFQLLIADPSEGGMSCKAAKIMANFQYYHVAKEAHGYS